tara:strand:+ start:350 stop:703 length:354 start_codon:yes stop_codon:yes gene_type:complete
MNVILKDSFYGAILLGGISYLNQIYKNNPQYSKISGFLIGAPTGFFLGLNIFLNNNIDSAKNYTYHMGLGIIITFFAVLITLYLLNNELDSISIFVNLIILIFILIIYFKFEIYKFY